MKKIYNAPAARIFNVKPVAMIADSMKVSNDTVDASQSLVNEERPASTDGGSLWGNEW